jgi:hypothetical protein
MVCTDAGMSMVDYIEYTSEGFGSVGAWATALLENFLNSIASYIFIIEDIIEAEEVNDFEGVIYSSSRLVFVLFDFEPESLSAANPASQ